MRARTLLLAGFVVCFAAQALHAEGWKVVVGETSIISRMKGGITRDNLDMVYRVNTTTGEVQALLSSYGSKGVAATWLNLHQAESVDGAWDLVVGEQSLLMGVSKGDIDKESLYGALLVDCRSGKVLRLLMMTNGGRLAPVWHSLPLPPQSGPTQWGVTLTEHSVASFGGSDLARQNISSAFLCDSATGAVYRLNSTYSSDGTIASSWVGP